MLHIEIQEPLRSVLPELSRRFRSEGWWGDDTFGSRARRWAQEDADKPILRDDTRTLTRSSLVDAAERFGSALRRRGIGRGSIVGLQLPNCADYAIANIACEYVGAIWVNLSPSYRRHEMLEILGHLRADALVVAATDKGFDMRPLVADVRTQVSSLQTIVGYSDDPESLPDGWLRMSEMLDEPIDERLCEGSLQGDDIYSIMLSSGTTSARPKEALRSVNSMLCALRIMNETFAVGPEDRLLCLAPQTGGTGYSYSVAFPLITGAEVDVTEHGIGSALVERIQSCRPTVLVAVPTQMARLLDAAGGDHSMWSDLRLIINSGAPLLGDVAARAEEECGCPILSVYGATDGMVPVMTATEAPAQIRHSRVGRVMAGHQLRIVDEAGDEVPTGSIGEICGFGPGMAFGYVDNASEMARTWDAEGWWHSGDLGVMDGDGYLRIVGRKKEMILRGGVNISPLEIEELLNEHPDIHEAVVVAMPHDDLLEQVCAFVVSRDNRPMTLREVNDFLVDKGVAKYKLPERLEQRTEIPRTNVQKIDKLALGREITAIVDADRARTKRREDRDGSSGDR